MGEKRRNVKKKLIVSGIVLSGVYGVLDAVAKKRTITEKLDEENPFLMLRKSNSEGCKVTHNRQGFYEKLLKPAIDKTLAFGGMVVLAPVFVGLSLAVYIDDPGPVFFTQKRVGKDKHFFLLHKFRSMKMSAPHDVPTHKLSNPEKYITKVGKFLRKTSLDELPQIWDIFCGKMSVIGPRPALWNQEDLVGQRDLYGANSVLPGLTGLAQIKGRDELEIEDKAKLDGEYVRMLKQGGGKALFFDIKCFVATIKSVLKSDGVVEGGTGEIYKNSVKGIESIDVGFKDYGYKKKFHIDKSICKRILIMGANSYIGEYFEAYAGEYYGDNFSIDTIDTMDVAWRKADFGAYDTIFHVAGIAHADVGNVSKEIKKKYYKINTELAIEVARLAKAAGVKQFVFMSSMIIYGESAPFGKEKIINEHTVPEPVNFYGDSKWQADKGIRQMGNEGFHVAVLRLPMIYGAESRGNYPALAKLAKKLPVFPATENQRSMLYIENLCEFLCLLMLSGEGGIYFPQNAEYSSTSFLVREIGKAYGKKIHVCKLFNPIIRLCSHCPGKIGALTNKAFGNFVYSLKLSSYDGLNYQIKDLKESIMLTERKQRIENGKV